MSAPSKKQRLDPEATADPTKPLPLQRRRVWRACESCRRKKIKCDGREPTCGQCVTSRTACTWIQTKDRAALSRHYVQELEQRLLHMESLLAKVVGQSRGDIDSPSESHSQESSSIRKEDGSTLAIPDKPLTQDSGNAVLDTTSIKQEDLESSVAQLGQLALDGHGHLRWIGSSSTMSLIQSFRALTSEPSDRYSPPHSDSLASDYTGNLLYFPPGLGFGKVRALPGPQEVEYPDRDLADKLVTAYFDHLHFQLPVVHKPSFLKQYEELMNMSIDDRADASFVSVLFGVFACAARIVEDERLVLENGDGGMSMVYYERAMILYYIGHSNTQLAQVQCFVILASFLCSVNCLPQAWLIVGQALRIAQDLGLHRTPKHLPLSATEKQTRRKVWWSVYSLDRMLAIALGRPLGVDDRDCDTELPIQIDDDDLEAFLNSPAPKNSPCPMVGFVALSALFKIGGDILRRVYSVKGNVTSENELQATVDELDAQLTDWRERLPQAFRSVPSNAQQSRIGCTLASSYYAMLITLHRKSLSPRRMGRNPLAPGSNSVPKAVQSARACIRLAPSAKDTMPSSHHLAFFVQFLSTSAVIVLLFAMHAPDEDTAVTTMGEVQDALATLQTLEGRWPGARKCKELLDSLVEVAYGVMKHGNRHGTAPRNHGSDNHGKSSQSQSTPFQGSTQRSPTLPREDSAQLQKSTLKRARKYERNDATQPDSISSQAVANPFMTASYNGPQQNTSFYTTPHPLDTDTIPYTLDPSGSNYLQDDSSSPKWNVASNYVEPGGIQAPLPGPSVDPRFLSYSPTSAHHAAFNSSPVSSGSTPPLVPPFDTAVLPFGGLDFLHNFTPAGYSGVEDQRSMEALWQNIGPTAFNFDPDLQFALVGGTEDTVSNGHG